MSPHPRIRVTRETHSTPAAIAERITRVGGTNRYGEPNFRVVWGGARLTWIGGRWTDRDAHGNVSREAIELRQVPKYLPTDRWHIEGWMPPRILRLARPMARAHIRNRRRHADPALGPYPARGDYEHCFTLQTTAGEFEPLNAANRAQISAPQYPSAKPVAPATGTAPPTPPSTLSSPRNAHLSSVGFSLRHKETTFEMSRREETPASFFCMRAH